MPVEIRELIIRAKIIDSETNNTASEIDKNLSEKETIIAACVAQVLKILERRKER